MACKQIEQIKCSKINDAEGAVQKFSGNAVGEKRLPNTGISVEKQIIESVRKIVHKGTAPLQGSLGGLSGGKSGSVVFEIVGIIVQRKCIEIFSFQHLVQPRLCVKQ